jgi:hypothetical protein
MELGALLGRGRFGWDRIPGGIRRIWSVLGKARHVGSEETSVPERLPAEMLHGAAIPAE